MVINNIVAKANRVLWFIRRNLNRCSKTIKQQMYMALVRPHLEYACAVWDPHVETDINKIEMVQRRAARFVANNYSRAEGSVTSILNDMNWSSLEERRNNTRLTIMYKIHNNDITIPIPQYIRRQNVTSTRQYHPKKFIPVTTSKNVYKHSFFPSTISDWNRLPPSVIDKITTESFKAGLCNV